METGIKLTENQIQNLEGASAQKLIACFHINNPSGLIEIESNLTVASAMEGTGIRKMERIIGKSNLIKAISYLTMRLASNFNMKGNFSEEQAIILSSDLIEIFGYETLEDVVMMYKMARQGKIGDGRDFKLDGQTVLHKWVPAYLELKAIERENNHQKRKDSQKPANMPLNPKILESAGKEKVDSKKSGLGTRQREKLKTEHKSPIQKRDVYLNLLAEKIRNVKTSDLEIALEALENDPKEKDALQIVKKEIQSRKKKTA